MLSSLSCLCAEVGLSIGGCLFCTIAQRRNSVSANQDVFCTTVVELSFGGCALSGTQICFFAMADSKGSPPGSPPGLTSEEYKAWQSKTEAWEELIWIDQMMLSSQGHLDDDLFQLAVSPVLVIEKMWKKLQERLQWGTLEKSGPNVIGEGKKGWSQPFRKAAVMASLASTNRWQGACVLWWVNFLKKPDYPTSFTAVRNAYRAFFRASMKNQGSLRFPNMALMIKLHDTTALSNLLQLSSNGSTDGAFPPAFVLDLIHGHELVWGAICGMYVSVVLLNNDAGRWVDLFRGVQMLFLVGLEADEVLDAWIQSGEDASSLERIMAPNAIQQSWCFHEKELIVKKQHNLKKEPTADQMIQAHKDIEFSDETGPINSRKITVLRCIRKNWTSSSDIMQIVDRIHLVHGKHCLLENPYKLQDVWQSLLNKTERGLEDVLACMEIYLGRSELDPKAITQSFLKGRDNVVGYVLMIQIRAKCVQQLGKKFRGVPEAIQAHMLTCKAWSSAFPSKHQLEILKKKADKSFYAEFDDNDFRLLWIQCVNLMWCGAFDKDFKAAWAKTKDIQNMDTFFAACDELSQRFADIEAAQKRKVNSSVNLVEAASLSADPSKEDGDASDSSDTEQLDGPSLEQQFRKHIKSTVGQIFRNSISCLEHSPWCEDEDAIGKVVDSYSDNWSGEYGKRHRLILADPFCTAESTTRPFSKAQKFSKADLCKIRVSLGKLKDGDFFVGWDGFDQDNNASLRAAIDQAGLTKNLTVVMLEYDECKLPRTSNAGGAFGANNIEQMFVVCLKDLSKIVKKRKRKHYNGYSSSKGFHDLGLVPWHRMKNLSREVKCGIWTGGSRVPDCSTLAPESEVDAKRMGSAKGKLPLQWFQRPAIFNHEICRALNVKHQVILFVGAGYGVMGGLMTNDGRVIEQTVWTNNSMHTKFLTQVSVEFLVCECSRDRKDSHHSMHETEGAIDAIKSNFAELFQDPGKDTFEDDDPQPVSGAEDETEEPALKIPKKK